MSNNKTRLLWVDQLKAVGMFFVIWGHCVQRCANKVILQGIYSFHMPFFFILSGLTMNPNKYEKVTEFIQAKLKAIIYVDFPSIEDNMYGIGREIEPNTFLENMPGEEKIPHHYSDTEKHHYM